MLLESLAQPARAGTAQKQRSRQFSNEHAPGAKTWKNLLREFATTAAPCCLPERGNSSHNLGNEALHSQPSSRCGFLLHVPALWRLTLPSSGHATAGLVFTLRLLQRRRRVPLMSNVGRQIEDLPQLAALKAIQGLVQSLFHHALTLFGLVAVSREGIGAFPPPAAVRRYCGFVGRI